MNELLKSIIEKFPNRKLYLPLKGQRSDWNYHVLMCNTSMKDIWNRMTYYDMISSLSVIYKMNATILDIGTLRSHLRELFSINFFGLNTMRYQGFTEFKDNHLSSYVNQLHHVLNLNEFVLWDEPVFNMADGKVTRTYNDSLDMISKEPLNRKFFGDSVNKIYGNSITIETENNIAFTYCGLKHNSFLRYKIGDEVKAGQQIGNVGCCGAIAKRPFLHIEVGFKFLPSITPSIDQFREGEFPVPIVNFEPFYEMPLWTDFRDSREGIERMYVKDIKYIYNGGHFMRAGSLIKKTSNK